MRKTTRLTLTHLKTTVKGVVRTTKEQETAVTLMGLVLVGPRSQKMPSARKDGENDRAVHTNGSLGDRRRDREECGKIPIYR